MGKFTLSDDIEEINAPIPEKTEEKKGRFTLEEPSKLKKGTQIAYKNFSKGLINTLATAYEIGKPTSPLKPPSTFKQVLENASAITKELEDKFNLSPPEAESALERYIEASSEGAGAGTIFGPLGALGGAVGAAGGQTVREFGGPEWLAKTVDVVSSAINPLKLLQKSAQKLVTKSAEVAKRGAVTAQENLPKVRGILTEKSKGFKIQPAATPEAMRRFENKISNVIEKKTEDILEESLLGKQLESKGTIIGDLVNEAYEQTRQLAKDNPTMINLKGASKTIEQRINDIRKSAPSLADPTEHVLKKLEKYAKDFKNKKMSAEQLTNQWKEINKDLSALYKKSELNGAEELYRSSLEDVKDVLLKEAESQLKDPELINSFKQQNKIYNEARKFETAQTILNPIFENGFNPSKFKQVLSSEKKFSDLSKVLGKKNAFRLKDIQKYYVQPIEQMKKGFKVKSLFNLEDLVTGALVKKLLGLPVAVVTKVTPYAQGRLLMSESTQNLWVHLMRAIKDGSKRGVVKYSEALQKDLEKSSE